MDQHEELKRLRELVEKLQNENQNLRVQNENLTQAVLHAQKKIFGRTSESSAHMEGQLVLFAEERLVEELAEQQKKLTVQTHQRKPRQPGVRAEMIANLPTEVIRYETETQNGCPVCQGDLMKVGSKVVRSEVVYEPAVLKIVQHVQDVYKCKGCGQDGSGQSKDTFVKAGVPKPVLPHSLVSPSVAARVLYQKYDMGIPLKRQEKDWYNLGFVVNRQTMANWVIRICEEWLMPIYERIHRQLVRSEVLHCDETRIQCNKEPGKKPSSDSFMWVLCSGQEEEKQGVLFHYTRSRGGHHARDLMKGFRGILVTDAYAGYEKAEGVTRALCFAHLRRYWIESIPLDGSGKEIPGSMGAVGRAWCDRLFKIEREIKEMSPQDRLEVRKERSQPILEDYFAWVEEVSQKVTTNTKLTKAITYSQNQKKYLTTFLSDGRIPISNNWNESKLRNYAVSRRAWLFADSPKGAAASATAYTLVETAKMNGLDVYKYLEFLLEMMPNTDYLRNPKLLDAYLPWSDQLPEECRIKELYKKQSR